MGLLDLFKAAKPEPEPSVVRVMVSLQVEGDQELFVVLGSDGSVNRMGSGSSRQRDRDMHIGQLEPSQFQLVLPYVAPVIKSWIGGYTARDVAGKRCMLRLGFELSDGKEIFSQWGYGSESEGPPEEILKLVMACVHATQPWYEAAKRQTKQ